MGRTTYCGIALILCAVLLAVPRAVIGEGNRIERLPLSELDRIMQDPAGRSLVVAMAAWCKPCRKEMPTLVKLDAQYRNQGLRLIGIAVDVEGPSAMQPLVDHYKVGFPVYWVGEAALDRYGIDKIPMIFVVRNGKIMEKIPGKRSERYLKGKIEELLR